jgi:5-methylcytosine-specific restriction enzyme subunit McrC
LTREPLKLADLSPHEPRNAEEDAWLGRLAAHLADNDYALSLTGRHRVDEEDDAPLRRAGDGLWWTGRFIGEINFEGREVRIEPRLGIEVIGAWLARALNLSVLPKSATQTASGPLIAQLVDRMWSASLAEAGRHGPPRFRDTEVVAGLYVRGRLDVRGTARMRAARVPQLVSRVERRSLENPVSRALVLADRTLTSLLGPEKPWRPELAEELLGQLRGVVGVSPPLPSAREISRIRYTPISRPFQPLTRLSLEIARRRGTLTSGASDDTSGVLIDVAELWELFLLHCARRAFGESRVAHGAATSSTAFLLSSVADPSVRIGRLKPDLLISDRRGRERAVLDAKYKRLRSSAERPHGVDRGDLYQLAAYMSAHEVPQGALAYPPAPEDQATGADLGPWRLASGQLVQFVRLPSSEKECIASLQPFGP